MSEEKVLVQDLDALLDGTLDDLADIPEFKLYPPGVHRAIITSEFKAFSGSAKPNACVFNFKGIETEELPAGSTDEPISKDQVAQVTAILQHQNATAVEFGQGLFKMVLSAFAAKFGQKSNRELLAEGQNAEVRIVTGQRLVKGKNGNPDRTNVTLLAIEVV